MRKNDGNKGEENKADQWNKGGRGRKRVKDQNTK